MATKGTATTTAAPLTDAEAAKLAATGPLIPTPHPVPFLSPEEEIKTFKLPPGLHAELVACEPMVQHPVAVTWDADGRLWVCEMRGYMPDVEGHGEDQPNGRISILEDTDGDGRMDKSTVFLDKIVLPRSIAICRDGALVATPPKLLFCRDTNHDGVCDDMKTVVADDYGASGANPEHQANGLLYTLDNWYANADYSKRFRYDQFQWKTDYVRDCGQYGISQDDVGRLYFDTNSDYLRANYIPSAYAIRNPNYPVAGVNVRIAVDQECFPAHDTAENRGYRENFMRDGRLRAFTAACSPWIYRGDRLPKDYYGDAFVCEPSANLIRRATLTETEGIVTGKNAYVRDEFLTSTYERFRPVHLNVGPDGALYIVDMHHGLIQHSKFVTPYLKAQYLARELDKHLLTGRIFRIVPDAPTTAPSQQKPQLSRLLSAQLVEYLAHPNAWYRETAQRLLVERNNIAAVVPLRNMAQKSDNPLARIHALWTLEGMHRLDAPRIRIALADPDARVRAQAIRLAESILTSPQRNDLLADVLKLASDAQPNVRLQFALTVSGIGIPSTDAVITDLMHGDAHNEYVRDALISGMRGRELLLLEAICHDPEWASFVPGRDELCRSLAQAVMTEGNARRVARLLDLTAMEPAPPWRRAALLTGAEAAGKSKYARRLLLLADKPSTLVAMAKTQKEAKTLLTYVAWPGKPGYVPPPPPRPLTADEQARYESGAQLYAKTCIQCHKVDGLGQEGLAPPLVNSDWVLGSEQRFARIVLHGMRGPVNVDGRTFNLDMPSWLTLTDEQLASVLTYVRRSWDQGGDPVDVKVIQDVRKQTAGRAEAWSERELMRIK